MIPLVASADELQIVLPGILLTQGHEIPDLLFSFSRSQVAVGAHVFGGTLNKASVIGPLGNVFSNCIRPFGFLRQSARTLEQTRHTAFKGFRYVSVSILSDSETSVDGALLSCNGLVSGKNETWRLMKALLLKACLKMWPGLEAERVRSLPRRVLAARLPRVGRVL